MKKTHKHIVLKTLFWLLIVCGVLWLAFVPPQAQHHAPIVQVAVTPLLEPALQQPMPQATEAQPLGDEKTQPPGADTGAPLSIPVTPPEETTRPADTDHKPMIAIVIDDMGLDLKDSDRAVALPASVTLSYMPYATRLREQTEEARDHGHELLLHMPMEPVGQDDPGPGALLVGLSVDEVRQRFQAALASFGGFDGVNNHMGSKFTADAAGMDIVMDELQQRHLFFFDSRTSAKSVGVSVAHQHGLPVVARDVFLDDDLDLTLINHQLQQTERIAARKGFAIAIGHPHAVTLQALEIWLPEVEGRGFELVSLNKLVK